MWSTATGDAGKEEESVVVGGGDHLLPAEVMMTMMAMMMMMMMMIKIIALPALGGGDHRVLHAGKQQVRARHSFAWVPCATKSIGKRQEEMKGGGGWILASATTTTTITAGEAGCGYLWRVPAHCHS